MATMKRKVKSVINPKGLLAASGVRRVTRGYREGQTIFSQGDRADAVFFIERGQVKLTVLSTQGKQAVIALLGPETFFGRMPRVSHPYVDRDATTDCSIILLRSCGGPCAPQG